MQLSDVNKPLQLLGAVITLCLVNCALRVKVMQVGCGLESWPQGMCVFWDDLGFLEESQLRNTALLMCICFAKAGRKWSVMGGGST